ncbi:MAG: alpha/beta fold hydrolase [Saprospiraceae bacterium]
MKKVLKYLGYLLSLLLLLLIGLLAANFHADIPVETLKEKYTSEHSKFIEIDGMNVHYQRLGKGHPFVLVHGFSGHTWNWRAWMKHLPDDFDLIVMDLPGFGLTGPHPKGDYSSEMSIRFLDDFLTKIGVDTFHLAGNSMGGGISWAYTLAHPERVKKLVLIDAGGYPKKSKKNIAGFKILQYPIFHPLITKITPRSIIKQSLEGTYVDQSFATEKEVNLYMDMIRREGNRKVLIDRMKVPRKDKSHLIKNIDKPTLIMWGDKDIIIPVENAYLFEKDIANAELIIYENVGHIPMDEVGEQSAKDVRQFLKANE